MRLTVKMQQNHNGESKNTKYMIVIVKNPVPSSSSYIAEVVHRHPGSGHVEVRRLTPLTLHIFIVIFLVFKLQRTNNNQHLDDWFQRGFCCRVMHKGYKDNTNTLHIFTCLINHFRNDWNPCNSDLLLASLSQLSMVSNIREQVVSYPKQWLELVGLWGHCFHVGALCRFVPLRYNFN